MNRTYLGDTTAIPVCGRCRQPLPLDSSNVSLVDYKHIRVNTRGMPLPPRPNSWLRSCVREIVALFVKGNPLLESERKAEGDRFAEASRIYDKLVHTVQMEQADRMRVEREQQLRQEEQARRDLEAVRAREAEAQRIEMARRAEEEARRRNSQVVALEAQLAQVADMTGRQFELFLRDVFTCAGYEAEVTQESCDQGVDIIVKTQRGKLAIQAKNHAARVRNAAVQEVYTGGRYYDCHCVAVVSRSGFSSSARKLARKTCVELWTLDHVRRFLKEGRWFDP